MLLCPSDFPPDTTITIIAQHNYNFCAGDSVGTFYWPSGFPPGISVGNPPKVPVRGLFGPNTFTGMQEITDGTSNTAAISEIVRPPVGNTFGTNSNSASTPTSCLTRWTGTQYTGTLTTRERSLGTRRTDGRPGYIIFNTILPPNGPVCNGETGNGLYTAGSRHPGGANLVMADGSVRFVSQTIDTGNLAATPPAANTADKSPYGVWGAMGTKNSND